MTENRPFAGWLRLLTGLAAAAGVLALSACGGGSGAPNNFFKSTMVVLPTSAVAYTGIPTTLTITGGTGPFQAFSSNPGLLPVAQNVAGRTILLLGGGVTADTDVTITVQDLGPLQPVAPSQAVTVTVRAATLVNSLVITPNLDDCGTGLCSGQTGTATVKVTGPQGGPVAGRPVRFDVIGTAYSIVTNNPAQPLASTLTVLSDSTGTASVILQANTNAPTQFAQLSATDLTSGQQLIGNFIIVQVTDGSAILTVVPATATITGAFKGQCSSGFPIDYYIYGGTPPYRITSTFPASVTLVNSVVNTNGGFFRAITNGSCVNPLTFSIVDATGRQTTAELKNVEGTEDAPAPAALALSPTTVTDPAGCNGKTYTFIVSGGTPSYGAVSSPTGTVPTPVGNQVKVSGLPAGPGSYTVTVFDQSSPQKTASATITCS
jgi:hypothetical protein